VSQSTSTNDGIASISLRERKREATREALETAALKLVTERGIDGATIDDICAVAGFSHRTFFNYFPSKESALIAGLSLSFEGEFAEDFVGSHGEVYADLKRLLLRLVRTNQERGEQWRDRVILLAENPALIASRRDHQVELTRELVAVIRLRLPGEDRAEILAGMVMIAIATAVRRWSSARGDTPFDEVLHESFEVVDDIARTVVGAPTPIGGTLS
jgi:AcrR family transcriptional regulator